MLSNHAVIELQKTDSDPADDLLASMEVDGFHHGFHGSNSFNDLSSLLNNASSPPTVLLGPNHNTETLAAAPSTMVIVAPSSNRNSTASEEVVWTWPIGVTISASACTEPIHSSNISIGPVASDGHAIATTSTPETFPRITKSNATSKKRSAAEGKQGTTSPQKKKQTRRSASTKKSTQPSNTPSAMASLEKELATTNSPEPPTPFKIASTDFMIKNITTGNKIETPNPLQDESCSNATNPYATALPKVTISKKGGVSHNVKAIVSCIDKMSPVHVVSSTIAPVDAESNHVAAKPIDDKSQSLSQVSESSSGDVKDPESNSAFKIDTSTAHIKALTGNNWVGVCGGSSDIVLPGSVVEFDNKSSSSDAENNGSDGFTNNNVNRCKRQNLTADERARQNRDRNREHARNTRLRKKAYVEELKHTLTELVTQRDASETEKRHAVEREKEQREVRFRVIEEFLKLRGLNEANSSRWNTILEDEFTFSVPSIDFKNFPVTSVCSFEQVTLNGVQSVIADASNFNELLKVLMPQQKNSIAFKYSHERNDFFMDGCTGILDWTGFPIESTTAEVVSAGVGLKGTIRATFSPASNKLISAKMTFDTGAVLVEMHKQLQSYKVLLPPTNLSTSFGNYDQVSAAQVAACQAGAILDSLQMPCLTVVPVPTDVTVVLDTSSSSSSTSSSEEFGDKSGTDSDESVAEPMNSDKAKACKAFAVGEPGRTVTKSII